ncbi:class I SAM-dependent methyltransferase [Aliiruegeria lutimaris]|nr:class I SAM-dependent methyltransferase [Aliiruegeria lutimaris]
MKPDLHKYIKSGRNRVKGWFSRCDAEIFGAILDTQMTNGIEGSVVEIGTHHGKSFIPLALSNNSKNSYVIDIFEDQHYNIDSSGTGNKERFLKNIEEAGIDTSSITIDQRPSTDVLPADIVSKVGKSRFFHVDGGHNFETVSHDINLALAVQSDPGVICVDDAFRPEWPDVAAAIFRTDSFIKGDSVMFAIGFNKAYFCHKEQVSFYQDALLESRILKLFMTGSYKHGKTNVDIYQQLPLPEWKLKYRFWWYLKQYHPDVALALRDLLLRQ